jgi:hypothetical protein
LGELSSNYYHLSPRAPVLCALPRARVMSFSVKPLRLLHCRRQCWRGSCTATLRPARQPQHSVRAAAARERAGFNFFKNGFNFHIIERLARVVISLRMPITNIGVSSMLRMLKMFPTLSSVNFEKRFGASMGSEFIQKRPCVVHVRLPLTRHYARLRGPRIASENYSSSSTEAAASAPPPPPKHHAPSSPPQLAVESSLNRLEFAAFGIDCWEMAL